MRMKLRTKWLPVVAVAMLGLGNMVFGQGAAQAPAAMKPMAADADPSFAVATIKPSQPGEGVKSLPPVGYRTILRNLTVLKLVTFAYDVRPEQIVGAPKWVDSERIDIEGVSDTPGTPDVKQLKTMLQKLMVDRLQLKFHWEKRDLPAYALVVGKNGAAISQSKDSPHGLQAFYIKVNGTGSRTLTAKNVEVGELAHMLQSNVVDRPVVDETGMKGEYDFVLTWMPDDTQMSQGGTAAGSDGGTDAPGIFTAMQEQLGLKLRAEKTPVPVMVVDRLEQPSAN